MKKLFILLFAASWAGQAFADQSVQCLPVEPNEGVVPVNSDLGLALQFDRVERAECETTLAAAAEGVICTRSRTIFPDRDSFYLTRVANGEILYSDYYQYPMKLNDCIRVSSSAKSGKFCIRTVRHGWDMRNVDGSPIPWVYYPDQAACLAAIPGDASEPVKNVRCEGKDGPVRQALARADEATPFLAPRSINAAACQRLVQSARNGISCVGATGARGDLYGILNVSNSGHIGIVPTMFDVCLRQVETSKPGRFCSYDHDYFSDEYSYFVASTEDGFAVDNSRFMTLDACVEAL